MRCQRLPAHAHGHWTLWMRDRPGLWRFMAWGSLPHVEGLAGGVGPAGPEWLILPPGEHPIMARKDCHVEKYLDGPS